MKLSEIVVAAERHAPLSLSKEFCEKEGVYDNSGVLLDVKEDITGVLFSLDLTFSAIDEAKKQGKNLIITHHPAIYGATDKIGEKLVLCAKYGISVLSMHLNLDAASGGIDESLKEACEKATDTQGSKAERMVLLSSGGYGLAYPVNPTPLKTFAENLKNELHATNFSVFGDKEKPVRKVASFCGGGADEQAVLFAVKTGADVIVSSDFKHHILLLALENGLSVVAPTHYVAEAYGFKKFYEKLCVAIDVACGFYACDVMA